MTISGNVGGDSSGMEQSLVATVVTSSYQFWDMILTYGSACMTFLILVHFAELVGLVFLEIHEFHICFQ